MTQHITDRSLIRAALHDLDLLGHMCSWFVWWGTQQWYILHFAGWERHDVTHLARVSWFDLCYAGPAQHLRTEDMLYWWIMWIVIFPPFVTLPKETPKIQRYSPSLYMSMLYRLPWAFLTKQGSIVWPSHTEYRPYLHDVRARALVFRNAHNV